MSKLLELKQSEESLITQMRSAIDEADGKVSAEQRAKIDKIDADIANVRALIKAQTMVDEADARKADELNQRQEVAEKDLSSEQLEVIERKAFLGYLRGNGLADLTANERTAYTKALQRGQEKGTDSKGGYLTPVYFDNQVIERLKAYGGIMTEANIMNTADGNTFNMPTMDDTANMASIIAENAAVPSSELAVGRISIGSYEYTSGMFKVSNVLLRDSIVDVPGLIARAIATRFGRKWAVDFTTGTGSSQPQGIVTGVRAIAANGGVGVTAAAVAAVTGDELIDLIYSLDASYRNGAKFMMNDTTLAFVRKLKDGQGNYLWQMGDVAKGAPSSLLGKAIAENYQMDNLAASKTPILFGDFKDAYTIRKVGSTVLRRAEELYLETNEVGFVSFASADGKLTNPNAVKALITPAS